MFEMNKFIYYKFQSIGIRQCFQSIGDCTSDWHNVEDGQKCKSYTAYVETHLDGKLKVFKNWHCALCNGVPRDQIHCYGIIFRDLEDNMSPPLNYHSIKEVRSNSGEACKDNQVFDFVLHERCHSFSHLSDGHTSSTEKILLVDETDKSKKFPAVKNGDGNVSNCAPRTVIHQVFVVITIMFLCFCKESISRQEVA